MNQVSLFSRHEIDNIVKSLQNTDTDSGNLWTEDSHKTKMRRDGRSAQKDSLGCPHVHALWPRGIVQKAGVRQPSTTKTDTVTAYTVMCYRYVQMGKGG